MNDIEKAIKETIIHRFKNVTHGRLKGLNKMNLSGDIKDVRDTKFYLSLNGIIYLIRFYQSDCQSFLLVKVEELNSSFEDYNE